VIAQQVFMAELDLVAGPGRGFDVDAWDGYVASRDRLMAFLGAHPALNPVVLTGDFHSNWVADLKANFDDPASATVGTEFVGTSITSGGDGSDSTLTGTTALAENPHLRFYNGQRGYVRCTLTPTQWSSDYRVVPYVRRPDAPVSTRASFVVDAGHPGAHLV
jgi:alkaline phosphatase D